VIDWNEWKTEKRHECANVGKVKRLKLWRPLYPRHCLSGTYEISGRWIFFRLSVPSALTLEECTEFCPYFVGCSVITVRQKLHLKYYAKKSVLQKIIRRMTNADINILLFSVSDRFPITAVLVYRQVNSITYLIHQNEKWQVRAPLLLNSTQFLFSPSLPSFVPSIFLPSSPLVRLTFTPLSNIKITLLL